MTGREFLRIGARTIDRYLASKKRDLRRHDPPLTALDRLLRMPGIDTTKLDPLVQLRSRLDPFALSATIRRKLAHLWGLRTKKIISDRATDPVKKRPKQRPSPGAWQDGWRRNRKDQARKKRPPSAAAKVRFLDGKMIPTKVRFLNGLTGDRTFN